MSSTLTKYRSSRLFGRAVSIGIILSLVFSLAAISMASASYQSNSDNGDRLCPPKSDIDLLIMVDESGSMEQPQRNAVKEALEVLRDQLGNEGIRVALSSFRNQALDPVREKFNIAKLSDREIAEVTNGVNDRDTNGTNYESAFEGARDIFRSHSQDNSCRILLFFTDGVAQKTTEENRGRGVPEGEIGEGSVPNTYAEDQRNNACESNGLADQLAKTDIKTIAIMLVPGSLDSLALKYSLEMLLAITSESMDADAVTQLADRLSEGQKFDTDDCDAYDQNNDGKIISVTDTGDIVNALLLPILQISQFTLADCPQLEGTEFVTDEYPAGKFIRDLSFLVFGGDILRAWTNQSVKDLIQGSPQDNLKLGASDLEGYDPGWRLTLDVGTYENASLTCVGTARHQGDIKGSLVIGQEEIYTIERTKSGTYDPKTVDIVVPFACTNGDRAVIDFPNWGATEVPCVENGFVFSGVVLEDIEGGKVSDAELCIKPEHGEALWGGKECFNDDGWPHANVTFQVSVFEEGEVGIDCVSQPPQLVIGDQTMVEVECILQQSDEADTTRFELKWDGGDAGPWSFENGATEIELEKGSTADNPYVISAPYSPEDPLEGEICVKPSEIRGVQPPDPVEVSGGNCVDVNFIEIVTDKLNSLIECLNNNVFFGSGGEVPEEKVKEQTKCKVSEFPGADVKIDLNPVTQSIGSKQVQWGVSTNPDPDDCDSSVSIASGVIYLCSVDELPNTEINVNYLFGLTASLLVDGNTLVSSVEVEEIGAYIDYQGRSDVALAVLIGLLLCIGMALLAYSIWVFSMKKAARFGDLGGLAYAEHNFKAVGEFDDFDGSWKLKTFELDNWVPNANRDIAFPEESNGNKSMNLGTSTFEAKTASWWKPGQLAKGGWMHHERPGWIFKAKPASPSTEGIAPLAFNTLVIAGIQTEAPSPMAVVYFIIPIGENMIEGATDQINTAHELFEELEVEYGSSIQTLDSSSPVEDFSGPPSGSPPSGGPPSGGPPSGGPPSGGPPSGGPPSGGPPSGGPPSGGPPS